MDQIIAENRRTETSLRESLLKKETEMETKLRDKEDLINNAETEIFKLVKQNYFFLFYLS